MKLNQNSRQAERMIKDFVEDRKGQLVTGRTIARQINDLWGVVIDWHDASAVLDHMHSCESVEVHHVDADGMTNYLVK